jgi:hypothetical protein
MVGGLENNALQRMDLEEGSQGQTEVASQI